MDQVYGTAANDETEKRIKILIKSQQLNNIKHYLNTKNTYRKMQPIKQDRQPSGNIDYFTQLFNTAYTACRWTPT
jgi:hypothetical protein